MAMKRLAIVAFVALWSAVCAGPARADDPEQAAVKACESAAEADAKKRHPKAQKITLSDAKTSATSDAETGVTGVGEVLTKKGKAKRFTYTCRYNTQARRAEGVQTRWE